MRLLFFIPFVLFLAQVNSAELSASVNATMHSITLSPTSDLRTLKTTFLVENAACSDVSIIQNVVNGSHSSYEYETKAQKDDKPGFCSATISASAVKYKLYCGTSQTPFFNVQPPSADLYTILSNLVSEYEFGLLEMTSNALVLGDVDFDSIDSKRQSLLASRAVAYPSSTSVFEIGSDVVVLCMAEADTKNYEWLSIESTRAFDAGKWVVLLIRGPYHRGDMTSFLNLNLKEKDGLKFQFHVNIVIIGIERDSEVLYERLKQIDGDGNAHEDDSTWSDVAPVVLRLRTNEASKSDEHENEHGGVIDNSNKIAYVEMDKGGNGHVRLVSSSATATDSTLCLRWFFSTSEKPSDKLCIKRGNEPQQQQYDAGPLPLHLEPRSAGIWIFLVITILIIAVYIVYKITSGWRPADLVPTRGQYLMRMRNRGRRLLRGIGWAQRSRSQRMYAPLPT